MTAGKVPTLLLFGATGDLAHRMLLPSLYALHADDLLPPALKIVATARSTLDDGAYRASAIDALAEHVPAALFDPATAKAFAGRLSYVPLDATVPETSIPPMSGKRLRIFPAPVAARASL